MAIYGNHTDAITTLLDGGADPNAEDEHGDISLHIAADEGNTDVAKILRDAGAIE